MFTLQGVYKKLASEIQISHNNYSDPSQKNVPTREYLFLRLAINDCKQLRMHVR